VGSGTRKGRHGWWLLKDVTASVLAFVDNCAGFEIKSLCLADEAKHTPG
jgi:hypothetical protein